MNQSIEEIKGMMDTGINPMGALALMLQKQLELFLESQSIKSQKQPLFLKTMLYYKLITKDTFNNLTSENSNIEEQARAVQNHSGLIQSDLRIHDIINHYQNEVITSYLNEVPGLDIRVTKVTNGQFRGASHPYFMGLLFVNFDRLENETEVATSIIHELAHQELFLLNMLDRLVTTSSNPRLIHSPYQGKIRPTIGRLHSAHALLRMIQLGKKMNYASVEKHSKYLRDTILTFSKDELTEFGSYLVNIYSKEVG